MLNDHRINQLPIISKIDGMLVLNQNWNFWNYFWLNVNDGSFEVSSYQEELIGDSNRELFIKFLLSKNSFDSSDQFWLIPVILSAFHFF